MKIRINRDTLIKGLNWVQSVVEKRSTMPVLSHALFKAYKGELEVAATNLQMVIEGHLEAEVDVEGGISLNARRVHDIIRALPPGEIVIDTDERNRAEIKGEKGTFHLMGLEESEYPPLPEYKETPLVEIKAEVLKAMVEKTIFAASMEETRYNLEGVLIQFEEKGKSLRMVATDGHRLCLVDKEVENAEKLQLAKGLILPRKGLSELRRILAEGDRVENVGFGVIGNDVVFKAGNVALIMRTLEGEYPNYDRVIPKGNDKVITMKRIDLLEAINRVSIISEEKTKGIKLSVSTGKLRVESQNPEVGDAFEEIAADTEIKKMEIGYNAKYLIDALGAMEGEGLNLLLKDELSSGLFKTEEDEKYICVVMPMRL